MRRTSTEGEGFLRLGEFNIADSDFPIFAFLLFLLSGDMLRFLFGERLRLDGEFEFFRLTLVRLSFSTCTLVGSFIWQ